MDSAQNTLQMLGLQPRKQSKETLTAVRLAYSQTKKKKGVKKDRP